MTRAKAAALGLKHFFSGEPCKFGHIDERWVCNNECRECNRRRSKNYQIANREIKKEKNLRQYRAIRGAILALRELGYPI